MPRRARSDAEAAAPRVWVLLGGRMGDNAQLIALAECLGWPYEVKRLVYNGLFACPNLLLGASLASLRRARSSALGPPWPDLVIAGGRRSVPVARYIRNRSGGRTRLVQLGRPRAPLRLFDLVITTPQYRLPAAPNVLHNAAPLTSAPDPGRPEVAAAWAERLGNLPRPFTALLVGGNSWPYVLDPATARRLGGEASGRCRAEGGSLLVTTGPRTPEAAADALEAAISCPAYRHRWHRGSGPENPYAAYLALADSFIVTGDSASMLADALATGKPVQLFGLPKWYEARPALRRLVRPLVGYGRARATAGPGSEPAQRRNVVRRLAEALAAAGLITPPRDLGAYHRILEARGLIQSMGPGGRAAPPGPRPTRPALDEMERAVQRVRHIMGAGPSAP